MRTTLVTGAAGFVGSALARRLIESTRGPISAGVPAASNERLILVDLAPRPEWCPGDTPGIEWHQGEVGSGDLLDRVFSQPVDRIAHLAGVVSGAAESDFDRGLRVNLDATRALLDRCTKQGRAGRVPRLAYASSIAVHGVPLPVVIDDLTAPSPSLSYGVQKLIVELLISELSRRGWVDGISLRLSGVVVRPALPNGALSGFNSDLIRETLAGRPVVSPVSAEAVIWLQSLDSAVGALLAALDCRGGAPDGARVVQLPAVAASIGEILDEVGRATGRNARALVEFRPDPAIEPMFGRWPRVCRFDRARSMGLPADAGLEALIARSAAST